MNSTKEFLVILGKYVGTFLILGILLLIYDIFIVGLPAVRMFYNREINHISDMLDKPDAPFKYADIYSKESDTFFCLYYESKLCFPSDCTGYIFNAEGKLVDSSLDVGDDSNFEKKWRCGDSHINISDSELKILFSKPR